jgi:hypothetical protein
VISVLAIVWKVRGSSPVEGDGFLSVIKYAMPYYSTECLRSLKTDT